MLPDSVRLEAARFHKFLSANFTDGFLGLIMLFVCVLSQIHGETEGEAANVTHVVASARVDASHVPTQAVLVDEGFLTLIALLRFFASVAEADVSAGK